MHYGKYFLLVLVVGVSTTLQAGEFERRRELSWSKYEGTVERSQVDDFAPYIRAAIRQPNATIQYGPGGMAFYNREIIVNQGQYVCKIQLSMTVSLSCIDTEGNIIGVLSGNKLKRLIR